MIRVSALHEKIVIKESVVGENRVPERIRRLAVIASLLIVLALIFWIDRGSRSAATFDGLG